MLTAADVIAELKIAAAGKGFDFSDASASHFVSQLDVGRLSAMRLEDRAELYAFLFDGLQQTYSTERNFRGQITLHEPDADTIIANIRSRRLSGRLRDLWCTIFIGGCP